MFLSRPLSGPLAQLVEQLTFNQWVTGSNPVRLTTKINDLAEIIHKPVKPRVSKQSAIFATCAPVRDLCLFVRKGLVALSYSCVTKRNPYQYSHI